ncbi:hypothetical protein P5P86_06230 [Nocardioides sp. BP30]|uniref:hypothetical protein n=1 Tax=Nocardioides sp. BP30 TaxID=3036374 RepID=UPI002469C1B8|nr:hypothetical protein [Nocardioides sp. BP30]WGL53424.1 hypothetical protein P5P86_06230 [Nocardioides sp. BP30]
MTGMSGDDGVERATADREEELTRALRAPGTPGELADEATYRTLFRTHAAHSDGLGAGSQRRPGMTAVRRIGIGSALAVTFAAASAGVAAAAYSNHLPHPVQTVAHRLLAPIGVPAAGPAHGGGAHHRPGARDGSTRPAPAHGSATAHPPTHPVSATPSESASPSPTPQTSTSPSLEPSTTPSTETSASAVGSASATAGTVPSDAPSSAVPTGTSAPVGSAPKPAAMSILASTHRVDPGDAASFTGVVRDADGDGLPRVRVTLQRRLSGGWRLVAVARSTSDGSVSVSAPAAGQSARYRFHAPGVHSAAWRLALRPAVTASGSVSSGTATVLASVVGAQPGDRVQLLASRAGRSVVVAGARLGSDGRVRLSVAQTKTRQRYVVVLPSTAAHLGVRVPVVLTSAARADAPPS